MAPSSNISVNTASLVKACYKQVRLGLELALAKPSSYGFFAENLDNLLTEHGKAAALSRATGIDAASVTRMRKGRQAPTLEQLDAIADFLGTLPSLLLVKGRDPNHLGLTPRMAWRIVGHALPEDPNESVKKT